MMRALGRLGVVGVVLVAVGAGTATAMMHVRLKLEILELGYSLGREAQAERELEQAAERLRVELALLKSPARIEGTARTELMLDSPEPSQIYRIDPNRPIVPLFSEAPVAANAAKPVKKPRPAKAAQAGGRPNRPGRVQLSPSDSPPPRRLARAPEIR
jgi:hypothetical protein